MDGSLNDVVAPARGSFVSNASFGNCNSAARVRSTLDPSMNGLATVREELGMEDPLIALIVGAVVATVAAMLASLTETLKVKWSARQETSSWRRQTMFAVAHEYVESAFALAGIAGNARRERCRGRNLEDLQTFLDQCRDHHVVMIRSLSAFRLVAPNQVVEAAEDVHDTCHVLINLAMGGSEPGSTAESSEDHWDQCKAAAREARYVLIGAVRRTFGIEETIPFNAKMESSWTVPADSHPQADISFRQSAG